MLISYKAFGGYFNLVLLCLVVCCVWHNVVLFGYCF